MIFIVLIKGVPSKTATVVTTQNLFGGGVLDRQSMEIVINPYDKHTITAGDYLKRRIGGKLIALSMGPDIKLDPILKDLYLSEIKGIDEHVILSDRLMAGADTWATAYAISMGVKTIIDNNVQPLYDVINALDDNVPIALLEQKLIDLYDDNLIPNKLFSTLISVKNSLFVEFKNKRISKKQFKNGVKEIIEDTKKFVILSGIKTSDGETGSVGPQVAEALSEALGILIPHAIYIQDINYIDNKNLLELEQKFMSNYRMMNVTIPSLITISPEYHPRVIPAHNVMEIRNNDYKGKITTASIWDHSLISAEPDKLGLAGSPTLVGPGVEVGKPPVQKIIENTLIFKKDVEKFTIDDVEFGPYHKGDIIPDLPEDQLNSFLQDKIIGNFDYTDLFSETLMGDISNG